MSQLGNGQTERAADATPGADRQAGEPLRVGRTNFLPAEPPLREPAGWSPGDTRPGPPAVGRDRPARSRIFAPGQEAAGRYLIERFVAQGAMGEVYEAVDLQLREHIALKTVRSDIAEAPRTLERFRREVHLARRVTHVNVCRLFDLQVHHEPPGPDASEPGLPILFLSMELLSGETLAARLRRDGPMSPQEALPLARQMAAGLQAAHDAGVIHRDFKSGNVMLVPANGGLRAVITDFGMASAAGDGGQIPLTGEGAMVGTPAYMAPEQVEGGEVTSAADVYAFGIVLYEMVTGKRPFTGDTMMSMLLRRLREPAPSPRLHEPGLDLRWEAVLLRCLERQPDRRFASTGEVIRALEHGEMPHAGPPALPRKRRAWRPILAAVALLGAGLAGYRAWDRPLEPASPSGPAAVQPRRSVAVLGFKNLVNRREADWLAGAFAELLATELSAGEHLRIVAGENVAFAKMELGLEEVEILAPQTLARLRQRLDADFVLLGSYLALGPIATGKIRLDLRLQDVTSGDTTAQISEEGTESELLEMVSRLGARLRERLGIGALSGADMEGLLAARPGNPEAARLYSAGLARLRQADVQAARDLLVQAVSADPKFAPSHSALAAAWEGLGYDARAQDAARKAFELSSGLLREDRMAVQGRYYQAMRDWEGAMRVERELWGLFPDDIEHGLRLAEVQTLAGRGQEALATVAALRALPSPARSDPRIDLAEAAAAASLSDFRRQLEAAGRAVAGGRSRGAQILAAQAHLSLWWAHRNLGELENAVADASEARRIYAEAGHRSGVARALNALATVLLDLGSLDAAYATDMQAIEIFREIGDQRRVAWALNNLARVLRARGQLALARQRYTESMAICREIDDRSGLGRALANTGRVLLEEGRLADARSLFDESLAVRRAIGERRGVAGATFDAGMVSMRQGRLEEAEKLCREAIELFRQVGDLQSASYVLEFLGEVLAARDRLEEARSSIEEAVSIRSGLGLLRLEAASRLALARLDLEAGRLPEAEAAARELLEQRLDQMSDPEPAEALNVLALALLGLGRPAEALQAAEKAFEQLQASEFLLERLQVEIATCRVRAAAGAEAGSNESRLSAIEAEAVGAGLQGLALEARLARGQIELASGRTQAGRATLAAAARDAAAGGFALAARRAAEWR